MISITSHLRKKFWIARRCLRMIMFYRTWGTAIRNRFLEPSRATEVRYELRTGQVFFMEPGWIDIYLIDEIVRLRLYEYNKEFRIRNGWTVVDVGAHKGTFSVNAAVTGEDTEVHSVEPAPLNYSFLERNVAANKLNNVTLHNLAVWTEPAELDLTLGHSWDHTLIPVEDSPSAKKVRVNAVTLKEVLERVGSQVDLLKVDIEGVEYPLFKSLPPNTLRTVQRIIVECDRVTDETRDAIAGAISSALECQGFDCVTRVTGETLIFGTRIAQDGTQT